MHVSWRDSQDGVSFVKTQKLRLWNCFCNVRHETCVIVLIKQYKKGTIAGLPPNMYMDGAPISNLRSNPEFPIFLSSPSCFLLLPRQPLWSKMERVTGSLRRRRSRCFHQGMQMRWKTCVHITAAAAAASFCVTILSWMVK